MTVAILAPHTGRRCKPKPTRGRRIRDWWRSRRRGRHVENARDEAYAIRLQAHHDVPPAAAARVTADVLGAVLATATGPLPPAMQDEDGERPWEYETGQFTKLIAAMDQPPRTAGQF